MKTQFYETERLILRPTSVSDVDFIYQLVNTPKWLEYIGDRNVHSLEDAKKYIEEKIYPMHFKYGYGNYTVIRKSDQIKIGSCGIYCREGIDGVDIGFAFLPDYRGKGYAYESARFILDLAIDKYKLKEIKAITVKQNLPSQNLLKKLGLSFSKMITLPNDDCELMLFELKE